MPLDNAIARASSIHHLMIGDVPIFPVGSITAETRFSSIHTYAGIMVNSTILGASGDEIALWLFLEDDND